MISSFLQKYGFVFVVFTIVLLRFFFSLTNEFWFPDQDVLQIYLIGLKSFTTGMYPYFGADLVYNQAQIPGALQGYLVSAGWYILKTPESPYIVLSIVVSGSVCFLAWYASKRVTRLPRVFVWMYLLVLPWSFCYFTRIINPSYVVPGAILFFVGIFEIYPHLSKNVIPKWLCFYFLGFSIFWIMQLHLSWVLLGPFTLFAFYYLIQTRELRTILIQTLFFIIGCATTASLLVPTLLRYGTSNSNGTSAASLVQFHGENITSILKLLTSFIAYASFDINRFIGGNSAERVGFLNEYIWASPFTVCVGVIGLLQALFLVYSFIKTQKDNPMQRRVANLTIVSFVVFVVSTLFSSVVPASHAAVLFFPLVSIYSLHSIEHLWQYRWMRLTSRVVYGSVLILYSAIALKNYNTISMYQKRELIIRALEQHDYTLVGKRRYEK